MIEMRKWVAVPPPVVVPVGEVLTWEVTGQFVRFVLDEQEPPLDWVLEDFDFLPSTDSDSRFVLKLRNNGDSPRKLERFACIVKGFRDVEG